MRSAFAIRSDFREDGSETDATAFRDRVQGVRIQRDVERNPKVI